MTASKILIAFDSPALTDASLSSLLEAVGFGPAASYLAVQDLIARFFCPGTQGVFAVEAESGRLVGMSRVFTDNLFTTYISELCVHPDFQRAGVGSALVRAVIDRFGHTAIFADAFQQHVEVFSKHAIAPKQKLVACSRRPVTFETRTH